MKGPEDDAGLTGKIAIVSGGGAAGDGIGNGRAAAILLARAGTRVLVADLDLKLAERTVDMIKAEPKKSFEIMGADVKQTAEAFEKSQAYLRWQDRSANQKFFAGEHATFSKEAADLLLEAGIIRQIPDLSKLADTRFLK